MEDLGRASTQEQQLEVSFSYLDDSANQYESESEGSESTAGDAQIGRKDIELMNIVRAIAILVILTITTISAETVFIVARGAEESDFNAAYEESTQRLFDAFFERVDVALWATKAVATDLSVSVGSNPLMEWPFVTFPDFEARTISALRLATASSVLVSPSVPASQRENWEAYVVSTLGNLTVSATEEFVSAPSVSYYSSGRSVQDGIYRFYNGTSSDISNEDPTRSYSPIRHIMAPSIEPDAGVLFDELTNEVRSEAINFSVQQRSTLMSGFLYRNTNLTDFAFHSTPFTSLIYPVLNNSEGPAVATVGMEIEFTDLFRDILVDSFEVIQLVLQNKCGGVFTIEISGPDAQYQAEGEARFFIDDVSGYQPRNTTYAELDALFEQHSLGNTFECSYVLTSFASETFASHFLTTLPNVYRAIVLAFFFMLTCILVGYDCLIERRQTNVVNAAERSDALVRSLFPMEVRNRLYEEAERREEEKKLAQQQKTDRANWKVSGADGKRFILSPKTKMKTMELDSEHHNSGSDPIADLYPNTTILFSDLAGFTAWSSEREPSQVFKLLETLYRSMDKMAKKMGVFKVETIGDCYVAATGLPEAQEDHAERMLKFARAALLRVNALTRVMEAELGPGTSELSMRVGVHSGSVTAGVLRGQKARFQLFGDTMNMASRMESTGEVNKIQISQDTAKILAETHKQHWYTPRVDKVFVKGKGEMQTFWLLLGSTYATSELTNEMEALVEVPSKEPKKLRRRAIWAGTDLEGVLGVTSISESQERLVDWNTDVLLASLKRIMAQREAKYGESAPNVAPANEYQIETGLVLDEVQMVIRMPEFDPKLAEQSLDEDFQLHPRVVTELKDYVACIASGYRRNAFHSFEHASHVILSANKLLKRVMNPDAVGPGNNTMVTNKELHDHTYGIGSDPLTQFAIVFAALVHDVGHTGHPSNAQLEQEEPDLADQYMYRCIAEQFSVDIAWNLLMLPHFRHLRACIYKDPDECRRFRELFVNSVMATDIFDQDLKTLRENRWSQSFAASKEHGEQVDGKATVVIEHLLQASDVAHTMQHWHIYIKWNSRLFQEHYKAFRAGRTEEDPGDGWYEGELWFLDNYVLPLARKLEECGVFGVSSAEYLNYAEKNRSEWEDKGHELVTKWRREALRSTEGIPTLASIPQGIGEDDTCTISLSDDDRSKETFDISKEFVLEDIVEDDEEEEEEEDRKMPAKLCIDEDDYSSHINDEPQPRVMPPFPSLSPQKQSSKQSVPSTADITPKPVPKPPPVFMYEASPSMTPRPSYSHVRQVQAPPGPLNIVLETHHSGPMIHQVGRASPVKGKLLVSDRILAIDGIPTTNLSADAMTALMEAKLHQPRVFTVEQVNNLRFT